MSKLRGAVVGVGYLGTFHAQKYKNNPYVELVGVSDHSPAQSDKVAHQLGVPSFHSPEGLIGQVDLVTIAASTLSHYELAKLFLENNIHVNVEKPITATVEQAQELISLAERKNLKLAVGHIERFNPAILELRRHLKNPRFVELNRMATFKARGADVSVLHDLMIHDIDLLLWLTGSEIESMQGVGRNIVSHELDLATVSFNMKNGAHAVINVSRVSSYMQRHIRVIDDHCTWLAQTGTLEIEKISKSNSSEEPVRIEKWTLDKCDALQSETDAFIEAVSKNAPVAVSGQDGLKALQVVEDILKMLRI